MGGVKQGFRGDTTAVQTYAAKSLVALDENDFLAHVRCVKRSRVSARAGANDNNFSFDRIHVKSRLNFYHILAEVLQRREQIDREPRRAAAINHEMVI